MRVGWTRVRIFILAGLVAVLVTTGLMVKTWKGMVPWTRPLAELLKEVSKPSLVDRYGNPLTVTYTNPWNTSPLSLHQIPDRLKELFLFSEDKRFFRHRGMDWKARFHALAQNFWAFHTVRGASTITEQVVRMVHPRKRRIWARWIEGFEAMSLERSNTKASIFEFYLNQVPYAGNRRGVAQAALYYFNRSLDTLSLKEMMALVVLVRAPSSYDLGKNPGAIQPALARFGGSAFDRGMITALELARAIKGSFQLEPPGPIVEARHFAQFALAALKTESSLFQGQVLPMHGPLSDNEPGGVPGRITTTLDGPLQNFARTTMVERVADLYNRGGSNGACLVVDHKNRGILAWVCVGGDDSRLINSVRVPRQPGSTLKPFLYALALEQGWNAARLIQDTPLANPVGTGLHTYHNYSRRYYGPVTLRQALGNSLNIPAIRTIGFTGVDAFLSTLSSLGITSLDRHPEFYGDGLALGNGEVTLYELVQAYATLACQGLFSPLTWRADPCWNPKRTRVFSRETASIIANILSDPDARELEFGRGSLLNFPLETAVKTGTSNDYNDAWTVGFNNDYTVGAWMGNLDGHPMDGVTGATGPAMVVRSIFAWLNQKGNTAPLYLSPNLIRKKVFQAVPNTRAPQDEWFVPGTEPGGVGKIKVYGTDRLKEGGAVSKNRGANQDRIGFLKPVNGLEMAMDPRIPDRDEAFEFELLGVDPTDRVEWCLNGKRLGVTQGGKYLWQLEPGSHLVHAHVFKPGDHWRDHQVRFIVK
ncbi:penicillin binding family protein [Desulforapulum autotrophicum HRM2]|uniref:peptidoglycan glycosyltransferase n=2 Tax=Desulforapulum autotrophicum TaxID=2296 RepID=C0QB31_DESAH|nr:penicillin binding family protein [Desulforapulum autotrophicum HRM2]